MGSLFRAWHHVLLTRIQCSRASSHKDPVVCDASLYAGSLENDKSIDGYKRFDAACFIVSLRERWGFQHFSLPFPPVRMSGVLSYALGILACRRASTRLLTSPLIVGILRGWQAMDFNDTIVQFVCRLHL